MLVALVAILVLIGWGLWALWQALFAGDDAGAQPAEVTETLAESASDAPVGGDPVACSSENLSLAMTTTGRYAGAPVDFTVELTNNGQTDCLIDAGAGNLVVQVTSGNDSVWSSAHCAAEESRMLLLGPAGTSEALLTWPGTRSAEGCPEGAGVVQPGTYRAALVLDGVELGDTASVFALEEAPPPPETPSDGEPGTDE